MLTSKIKRRLANLLPNGKPKYVRVYDNDGLKHTRYVVVFTGNYRKHSDGDYWHIAMSRNPQEGGFDFDWTSGMMIDRPTSSHIGHQISFDDLPRRCQEMTIRYYVDLWELPIPQGI